MPVDSCILHVGMPKTGTSSIQESLYHGLEDPRFRLISLGWKNAAAYLEPLFGDRPEMFWRFRAKRYSSPRIHRIRQAWERRLRRALRRARSRSQTPILTAERCWQAPPSELERLRDFLVAEGFRPRVVAYVRPIKSYAESLFQQDVKWDRSTFDPLLGLRDDGGSTLSAWSHRLAICARIYGRDNLIIRPFVRSALVEGCAVRDFCRTLGIAIDPRKVVRANESLCADAVRFLYAHNRFVQAGPPPSFFGRVLLVKHFEDLDGEPFRYHSEVFAPVADQIASETSAVRDRYGIDISADLQAADGGPCVREEADLFRYSRASLDWLAKTSGSATIGPSEGVAAARAVAAQVERVRLRPSWRKARALLAGNLHSTLRWIRQGD